MKIARYWARGQATTQPPGGETASGAAASGGEDHQISCWRWSETSQEEAQQRADEAAREAARRFAQGLGNGPYGYLDRPPREEIVKEITDDGDQTIATITRNSYGSLILNTRDLMFIDVDLPGEPVGAAIMRGLKGLLGRREKSPRTLLQERLQQIAAEQRDSTTRIYATRGGFRCAIVNRPITPGSHESERLLSHFEADPLYVRLCQIQESYRVRLTPKHWRCGIRQPPARYPFRDQPQEQAYRAWEQEYEAECQDFATCRFVDEIGSQPITSDYELLIELHDHLTRVADAGDGMELA